MTKQEVKKFRPNIHIDTSIPEMEVKSSSPKNSGLSVSYEERIESEYQWCCVPTDVCGLIVGDEEDECDEDGDHGDGDESSLWSIGSSVLSSDSNLATLRKSLSREINDLNKVQRLSLSSANLALPTIMQQSNVKFSDPLVTSVKSRPRTEKTNVREFYYSDGDINRFEREKSMFDESEKAPSRTLSVSLSSVASWTDSDSTCSVRDIISK